MPVSRVHAIVVALLAGTIACGPHAPSGAAGTEAPSVESRDSTLANVIMTSFQWAAKNRLRSSTRGAFWTTIYGHSETRGTPTLYLIAGPRLDVAHSAPSRETTDTLVQRLARELHLAAVDANRTLVSSDFVDFDALLYLTSLDLRGDVAYAVMSVAFDDAGARRRMERGEERAERGDTEYCLRLTRHADIWSVVQSRRWDPYRAPVCR